MAMSMMKEETVFTPFTGLELAEAPVTQNVCMYCLNRTSPLSAPAEL
jgi:hypothetical protein